MLNIKINKLVIMTGLFILFNSFILFQNVIRHRNFQQLSFPYYPTVNEYYESSINSNYNKIISRSSLNGLKVKINSEDGVIKTYGFRFEDKLFGKTKVFIDSIISFQSFKVTKDSEDRIIKILRVQDSIKYIDSTVYDSLGRIFYHSHKEQNFRKKIIEDTSQYSNWTRNTSCDYTLLKYKTDSYELTYADSYVIELNNKNEILKIRSLTPNYESFTDSLSYLKKIDTLIISHYAKDFLDSNNYYIYNSFIFLKDKIISEKQFRRITLGKPTSLIDKKLYYYDNYDNLILTKKGLYNERIIIYDYLENTSLISYIIYTGIDYSSTNSTSSSIYYSYYHSKENSINFEELIQYRLFRNMSLKKQRRYYIRKWKGKKNYRLVN